MRDDRREDAFEIDGYRISQTLEYIDVVLEGCWLLHQLLVVSLDQSAASLTVLVNMCYVIAPEVEPHAQEL